MYVKNASEVEILKILVKKIYPKSLKYNQWTKNTTKNDRTCQEILSVIPENVRILL